MRAVLYVLLPQPQRSTAVPDGPPLAVMLAAPSSTETPPSDAAMALHATPDPAQQEPTPDQPPRLAEGPRGTIAPVRSPSEVAPRPISAIVASLAAAAPPPIAAPLASEVAAPVEGASRQAGSAVASWESLVAARLEKAKRFPLTARMANEQDTVVVSFSVDAQGRTSNARIRRSAGYEDLEREVLSLIARVSPLPPPPDRGARAISVPVEFRVNR